MVQSINVLIRRFYKWTVGDTTTEPPRHAVTLNLATVVGTEFVFILHETFVYLVK